MHAHETRALLTIVLMAAFADGKKHDRERTQVRQIADSLANDAAVQLPALVQDVLLRRVSLASVVPVLTSPGTRQLAYEMAVCVCDADGEQSAVERAFLTELARALGLEGPAAAAVDAQAVALVAEVAAPTTTTAPAPTASSASASSALPSSASTALSMAGAAAAASSAVPASARVPTVDEAELDRSILNAAILNGALELLPESLSTMAIIPLQMKLVYRIGQAYGYQLDSGHVKDFLATVGVGLTSQYLEQVGRKLLGGLLGKVGGGLLRGAGKQAVSSGMSFAATYALGHVAKRYYAGGRTLSTDMLKDAYRNMTQEARDVQGKYGAQIAERARTLDAGKVLALVRGA